MITPEQTARITIDALLSSAGWAIQNIASLNLPAASGVAVREMQSHGGPADYILFVDGKALGVVEAKKEGTTLSAAADQSERYTNAHKWIPQRWADPLPFTYESTGIETNFRDQRDPDSRSRPVFAFHTPEHLLELVQQPDTLRARLRQFPALNTAPLRECQIDAVTSLEKSLAANRPRALIQMATGSGKTFTAVTQAYRLIKHAGAKRILFLVDRGNLGRQTVNEFQQFTTPDDGRKFTDLYNVQMLGPGGIDPVCKVTVSTIQRLYSQLSGNATFDDEADEHSGYEVSKVAEASSLSSSGKDQKRDASATLATIDRADALAQPSGRKFDMILANPPFGKKGGYTIVGDDGKISTEKQEYERDEFWATTANKQLNFLQHIVSELKVGGTAAVVLPDNVLFEGGAGETIRRELLKRCNVHTLLRLPTGIFYAQGVKANVLFFERKEASEKPWTKDLWIYDLRTNQHFTLKTNPLKESDLVDFVKCYKERDRVAAASRRSSSDDQRQDATATFKKFTYAEIVARDKANLDILWLKDDSLEDTENLPAPALLAAEIVESLEAALAEFRAVEEALTIIED